jgi:V/A-type H+/Na+-transporting ATPase subunit D
VNLFEKVKIPECADNIRRIRIFLGDENTGAVVRSKIAKGKTVKKAAAAEAAAREGSAA